jgi:hypothetical protein
MGATPKTGAVMFMGLSTKTTYTKAIYNADTAGTYCRIDNGAGTPGATGGADFCVFPEAVQLFDASFVTGIVDTANLRVMADYNPTSYVINWASHVNTLATRPALNIRFKAGTRISLQQLA